MIDSAGVENYVPVSDEQNLDSEQGLNSPGSSYAANISTFLTTHDGE